MKKWISCLLCVIMLTALIPNAVQADVWPARILPGKTGAYQKYNPSDGLKWLRDQEKMDNIIAEATALPEEDDSIYDVAKASIILKIDDPIAYAEGYKMYIDSKNTEIKPFIHNDRAFVPLRFVAENLGMKIEWDEASKSVVLSNSKRKIVITVGRNEIIVDGTPVAIDSSPINDSGRIFVPLRAIAESLNKEVLYDERGIVLVTSKAGKELLQEAHWDFMASEDFELDREMVMHPQPQEVIRWMMTSGHRARLNWDDARIQELIDPYMKMSYHELAQYVEETVKFNADGTQRHIGQRPDFEKAGQMMSVLYERTGDEDYAMRLIIMLYHSAIHFDDLATYDYEDGNFFYNYVYTIPEILFFSFDKIYRSPMWDIASEAYGFDLKQVIREWMVVVYDYIIVNRAKRPVGNFPTWIGALAGVAMILDEPEKVREIAAVFEEAFKEYNFYADGMWYEGSFEYGVQMVGNVGSGLEIVKAYRDPFGYVDEKYGYEFRTGIAGSDEWEAFSAHVESLRDLAYYPDGSRTALNDETWDKVETNLADNTIKEKYVKDNIELNHFGFYGLRYGDGEEAQQINLVLQASSAISHQHSTPLGISYFAGGMEVLPDQGYITDSALHRYSAASAYGHNAASFVEPSGMLENHAYWMGPNVLAYDNGSRNNKQVQLIEGSQLMTEETEADINRRAIMMIATDKNHSYVVDIQRMKGNINHETYLHQTQEEDVELETNLPLESEYQGLMSEWLSKKGIFNGRISQHSYAKVITNPQGLKTGDDFKFSWTGKTTGTTLDVYVKGNENTVVAFSDFPTVRRTDHDITKKNDFPGYIMYRGRAVTPKDITMFGSVYEGRRDGETAKVKNVTWYEPDDGDKMTAMLKVELDDYFDYIYISNDMESRSFEGITFSGNYAVVRKEKATGKVNYGYIYGEGTIEAGDYKLCGEKDLSYKVVQAGGARPIYDVENFLKVVGAPPSDVEGLWCNVTFSDNSGTAYRIEDVRQSVVVLHNDPGFIVDENGAKFTAYPMYEEADTGKLASFSYPYDYGTPQRRRDGDVILNIKYPTFDIN